MSQPAVTKQRMQLRFDPTLVLSFEPGDILDHFDGDREHMALLDGLTYDDLLTVGDWAIANDDLYKTFHKVLSQALTEFVAEKKGKAA